MIRIKTKVKDHLQNWNLRLFIELWIFTLIFNFFQFIWNSYSAEIDDIYFFTRISKFIGDILLKFTPPILNSSLHLDVVSNDASIVLPNGFNIIYSFNLSGLRQILLVLFVFIIISGPWSKKLWFIPLNIGIILVLILLRFVILTAHCTIYPQHFQLLQTILFGPIFYFEIIIMWIIWVLFIAKTGNREFVMPDIFRKPKR